MAESFGRYISAIYADRFDSYAGQKLQSDVPAVAAGLGNVCEAIGRGRALTAQISLSLWPLC
jgi:hypothetical protein